MNKKCNECVKRSETGREEVDEGPTDSVNMSVREHVHPAEGPPMCWLG